MTEVNVDRSKPCSHSAVVPLCHWLLAVINLETVSMLQLGNISWFCRWVKPALKLLLTGFAAVDIPL